MSYEAPVIGERGPVTDWATDYDLFEDGYVRDPYDIWPSCGPAAPSSPASGSAAPTW